MSIDTRTAPIAPRGGFAQLHCQRGFSLIEIMVSLVLLTIGLLALAGLQTRGLRGSSNSYQRSQANICAYDIIDRMRANRMAVYNTACAAVGGYNVTIGGGVPAVNAIATADLVQWKASLAFLRLGDGSVTAVVTAPATCEVVKTRAAVTVVVQWDDDRDPLNGAEEQIQITSQL